MYPLGTKNLTIEKKLISKVLLKIKSNFDPSKVHNFIFQPMVSNCKKFGVEFNMNY